MLIGLSTNEVIRKYGTKPVKKMVSLPPWLSYQADKEGLSLSKVLQAALKEKIEKKGRMRHEFSWNDTLLCVWLWFSSIHETISLFNGACFFRNGHQHVLGHLICWIHRPKHWCFLH
ncbi:hypothetical protein AR000_15065 [Listeria monocytogenes]|nr:hypothetical protein [Listeria monocytogenes]EAC9864705.1 hypothetical protein [Listeria monocytogenes]EAD0296434.1 hypothetical protein [Listeria monocytogenes]EAD1140853.1 hypothetical protein [Listeria monocytogenes]EAD1150139.1 hypothetical protein [Listeria monocytogenes]